MTREFAVPNAYKILLVDDDKELLASYIDELSSKYQVKVHTDSNAIPISDFDWADVLVADFNMPGKNGIEVMQDMLLNGCEVPVIFVRGYVPDLLKELTSVHVIEVLAKPLGLKKLGDYIDLYAKFRVEIESLKSSLMSNISNSGELNQRVAEFNEQKH
jgi:DNA-binding NtrC family response regulator